ncbi:trypsin-like serine peptidase [Clavibacter michiganensis]|uniref:Serine protease n=1 Tax=Clavibacter michiganensis subsp. insidiosus TaxID=33014 RepID=A0A399SS54_9MICO|nr:serine protease [Clavibacter michiganensis subsp. insidiosus]RIJ44797.1 serine protease [Clavibacter michiganensis subsp. insidiosus]
MFAHFADGDHGTPHTHEAAFQDETLDHWTPARLSSAVAHPIRRVKRRHATRTRSDKPALDESKGDATSSPIDTISHIGVIAFRVNGVEMTGTGNVVRSHNGLTVATAAHCVYPGVEATHIAFIPSYERGAPYTTWPVTHVTLPSGWRGGDGVSGDSAFLNVASPTGRTLSEVVGCSRVEFGREGSARATIVAYPSQAPFPGDVQYMTRGLLRRTEYEGIGVIEMPSDLGPGASGGPFFLKDHGELVQVSTLSGGMTSPPLVVAPFWDKAIEAAYHRASSH